MDFIWTPISNLWWEVSADLWWVFFHKCIMCKVSCIMCYADCGWIGCWLLNQFFSFVSINIEVLKISWWPSTFLCGYTERMQFFENRHAMLYTCKIKGIFSLPNWGTSLYIHSLRPYCEQVEGRLGPRGLQGCRPTGYCLIFASQGMLLMITGHL